MANKIYEESHIQAIADAIRYKNGTSNAYLVSQMGDAIRAIEGSENPSMGLLLQEKTITITENGITEVLPDDGHTISKVTVEVKVPTEGGLYDETYTQLLNGTVTDVTIPTGCTTIRTYAFSFLTSLQNVVIAESVTAIGTYAFRGCTGLKRIDIPSGIKTIGNYAFYNCTNITDMYCYPITPPTLNNSNAIPAYATIHVPVGSGDVYKSATNWSSLASKIVADIIIE